MRLSLFHLSNVTSMRLWTKRLPYILSAIKEADFVAIDMELTGLHSRVERYIGVDRSYEAHCEGAKNFIPLQIGLCAAKRHPSDACRWILTPASIYVYPRTERVFQVSTLALNFLKENNFDFNEWILHGVGYLKPKEEYEKVKAVQIRIDEIKSLRDSIEKQNLNNSSIAACPPPPLNNKCDVAEGEDKEIIEYVRKSVHEWIAGNMNEPLDIPMSSAFHRLLLHKIISEEFPNVYSHSTRKGEQRYISVYKCQSEVYDEQIRNLEEEKAKIVSQIGIRQIFDEISKNKKLVVGHNCFYDLLHLYQTFYDDLPSSLSEFKNTWSKLFPTCLDTKHLAETHELLSSLQPPSTLKGLCDFMAAVISSQPLTDSPSVCFQINSLSGTNWTLSPAYNRLMYTPPNATSVSVSKEDISSSLPSSSSLSVDFENLLQDVNKVANVDNEAAKKLQNNFLRGKEAFSQSNQNEENEKFCEEDCSHEAGFDSLMTSIVFILQTSYILQKKKMNWNTLHFLPNNSNLTKTNNCRSISDLFLLMINRIRLVKTQPNVINLGGKDESDMSRHFYMSGCPPNWKKWEIMKIWSPVWVSVCWIDETSCWIIARNDEDVKNIQMIYKVMQEPLFKLYTYEEYRNLQLTK